MSPGRRSSNPWNGEPKPSLEGPIDIKEFEMPQWALFAFRHDQSEIDFIHCRSLFSQDTVVEKREENVPLHAGFGQAVLFAANYSRLLFGVLKTL